MQWAWATSLDELWRSPSFPMWATLIAAAFFALVVLIVLLRADKTMANGALAVIALLALGIASTATIRSLGATARATLDTPLDARVATPQHVALAPALACMDGLAGESVEAACERAIFASADTAAAAVSYAAGQVSRVIAASHARTLTPEQQALRRAVERDRYGLVAQVVAVRDGCVVTECPLFRALSDSEQIKANMNQRVYDTLVARYSPTWTNAAATPSSAAAGLLPNVPTGRPTSVDFATPAAIPPVNIMTQDPSSAPALPAAAAAPAPVQPAPQAAPVPLPQPKPQTSAPAATPSNAQAQAKRQPANGSSNAGQSQAPAASVGRPRVVAPVPLVPSQIGNN